jgi:CRISPR-associated endonuclease Csy4
MDHYIDIKIKPDAEMRENVLLNKVYSKLHKALFSLKSTDIGVSFPKYKVLLGDVLRVHGTEIKLSELQNTEWLGGLVGYCDLTPVKEIPEGVTYRKISRIQANMTEAKLRRLVSRGTISTEEIKQYKTKMFSQGLDNPYFELESLSNGHKHRRYLVFGDKKAEVSVGKFDFFGLSKIATIPWF